jgi:hypothetical protein
MSVIKFGKGQQNYSQLSIGKRNFISYDQNKINKYSMVDAENLGFDVHVRKTSGIPENVHNIITKQNFAPLQKNSYETARAPRIHNRSVTECKVSFIRERNFFIRLVNEKLKAEMPFMDGFPVTMI